MNASFDLSPSSCRHDRLETLSPMSLWPYLSRINRLYGMMCPTKGRMTLLLVVALIASFSEALGLAMLMPLLSVALGTPQETMAPHSPMRLLHALLPAQNAVPVILGILVVLICVKGVFAVLNTYLSAKFVWALNATWNEKIFKRYIAFSFASYTAQKHGDLLNNLIQEPSAAAIALSRIIAFAVKLCLCVTMYAFLLALDWKITAMLTGFVLLILLPLNLLLKRRAHALGKRRLAESQELSSCTTESITGFQLVKAFGLETALSRRFRAINDRLKITRIKGQTITALITPTMEISVILLLVTMIYAMTNFDNARLLHILPQLATLVVIANRLMGHLSEMLSLRVAFSYNLPSLVLVHKLVSTSQGSEDLERGLPFEGLHSDILFQGVAFRYKEDEPLFENLTLAVRRGQTTALIGPSGAGKSTIAALLLGLYRPTGGTVRVNDRPLNDYKIGRASCRERV